MRTTIPRTLVVGMAAGMLSLATAAALADEGKSLRPEVEQMMEAVSEKLEAAADKLGLSDEQRAKIRDIRAQHVEQFNTLRTERRELLQAELKALGAILTAEQRDKVEDLVEDRIEKAQAGEPGMPHFVAPRGTLAERIQSAGDKLDLSTDQRKQIHQTLADFAGRHAALRARCRAAVEDEYKDIAAVLTPEQREKARNCIETRVMTAPAAMSIAARLHAVADKLALTPEQRQQIVKTHGEFANKYRQLNANRRELMQEEFKAIGAVLTPEQRDKVKNFFEDRVVTVEISVKGEDAAEIAKALRETVKERLEAVADKLELTDEQRAKIGETHAAFADKFEAQREQRKALRQEELKALDDILTPEQREKVKSFVEDNAESVK